MTREQMKNRIALIIVEKIGINHRLPEAKEAAEEIIRLWEFGYTWELK